MYTPLISPGNGFLSVLRNRSRNRNRRNRIILTQEEPEPEPYPCSRFRLRFRFWFLLQKNIKLNLLWRDTGQHMHEAGERRNKNQGNQQEFL